MAEGGDDEDGDDTETTVDDPFDQLPEDREGADPFEQLEGDLGARTTAGEDATDDDGHFESIDLSPETGGTGPTPELTPSSDPEEWARLLGDESAAPAAEQDQPEQAVSNEATVSKSAYCENCEHFSAPPQTACEYPGGSIEAVVDMEQFRVRNCPVVEQRRRRADLPAPGREDG